MHVRKIRRKLQVLIVLGFIPRCSDQPLRSTQWWRVKYEVSCEYLQKALGMHTWHTNSCKSPVVYVPICRLKITFGVTSYSPALMEPALQGPGGTQAGAQALSCLPLGQGHGVALAHAVQQWWSAFLRVKNRTEIIFSYLRSAYNCDDKKEKSMISSIC